MGGLYNILTDTEPPRARPGPSRPSSSSGGPPAAARCGGVTNPTTEHRDAVGRSEAQVGECIAHPGLSPGPINRRLRRRAQQLLLQPVHTLVRYNTRVHAVLCSRETRAAPKLDGLPPHRRPRRGPLASAAVRHHRGAGGRERRRAARGGGARRTARGAARVGALRGPPLAGPRPAHPRPAADQGAHRQGDVPRVAPRLEGDAEEAREAAHARVRRPRQRG